jgi:hypothetical protein
MIALPAGDNLQRLPPFRHTLVLVVAAAAITGVLAGLARLGIPAGWGGSHAAGHGPLLVLGVFGTVVALERAQALGARWSLAAPVAFAATAAATLLGWPATPWIAAASSGAMLAANLVAAGRRSTQVTWLLLAGSASLLLGNLQWAAGNPVFRVVPAWMGFFVLTIVAERQRHSRNAPPAASATRLLVAMVSILVGAVAVSAGGVRAGVHLLGAAMISLSIWQLRYDIARQTIRHAGYPRFMGIGARAGMLWLLVAGGLLMLGNLPPAGPVYDAALHAVFVGYVLSTAFAHSLDVLPTVAGVRIPFTPLLYAPLTLLHASLVVRMLGDVANVVLLRRIGAIGNALAIGLFGAVVLVAGLRRSIRPR